MRREPDVTAVADERRSADEEPWHGRVSICRTESQHTHVHTYDSTPPSWNPALTEQSDASEIGSTSTEPIHQMKMGRKKCVLYIARMYKVSTGL